MNICIVPSMSVQCVVDVFAHVSHHRQRVKGFVKQLDWVRETAFHGRYSGSRKFKRDPATEKFPPQYRSYVNQPEPREGVYRRGVDEERNDTPTIELNQ